MRIFIRFTATEESRLTILSQIVLDLSQVSQNEKTGIYSPV